MRRAMQTLMWTLGIGLILATGAPVASAQEGGYAPPPPPPPPPAPDTVSPAPAPAAPAATPPVRRPRRPRHRPSRWGRFYLGAGGGYVFPGGAVGRQLRSGGAYGVWAGWRKRWLGFEVGYLGANLTPELPDTVVMNADAGDPVTTSNVVIGAPPSARLGHLTADVKLFFRLICRSTLFARVGVNHTTLTLADRSRSSGFGYQYGAGLDYRIRLGYRPDLILKLRAEVVHVHAALQVGEDPDRRSLAGLYAMFYLNLGWSPR